ncbi:hypothetical protein ATJ88_2110 [Isoptericola jiangsuensis]|uniref:Alpha/beta hydrolase family protein n=1 Tax=Isoptericola jiangsuensis TaxID=548579 RepID=A0A2A9EXG0_9MICO|nr:hypothetical protein ATJ88_2110 [Isoptericola jiangsuensis]
MRALTAAGWRVESYDAPAHGASAGDRLTLLEHMAAMRAVEAACGPFDAVVGHSLGAFAAGTALHEGFSARHFVSLAAPTGFDSVVATYMRLVGLSPVLHERLCTRIAATTFPGHPDVRDRFDLLRHPVPDAVRTLFVQDTDDAMHGVAEAHALHAAHPGSERPAGHLRAGSQPRAGRRRHRARRRRAPRPRPRLTRSLNPSPSPPTVTGDARRRPAAPQEERRGVVCCRPSGDPEDQATSERSTYCRMPPLR